MSDFQERTDINTRALVQRVQDEVRTLRPLLGTVAELVKEVKLLGNEVAGLSAHREHSVTWFKLGAVAAGVVAACWLVVNAAVGAARAETKEQISAHRSDVSRHVADLEQRINNAHRILVEAAQRDTKTAGRK